jgi:hypothetical protein
MNIDPLNNSNFVPPARLNGQNQSRSGDASSGGGFDRLLAQLSTSVRDTLASLPEVRPEVVDRGRQLAADPSYPGQDIIQKIASLITPLPEY